MKQADVLMNANAHSAGLSSQACIRGLRSLFSPSEDASYMRYRVCEHGCQLAYPSEYDVWTVPRHLDRPPSSTLKGFCNISWKRTVRIPLSVKRRDDGMTHQLTQCAKSISPLEAHSFDTPGSQQFFSGMCNTASPFKNVRER